MRQLPAAITSWSFGQRQFALPLQLIPIAFQRQLRGVRHVPGITRLTAISQPKRRHISWRRFGIRPVTRMDDQPSMIAQQARQQAVVPPSLAKGISQLETAGHIHPLAKTIQILILKPSQHRLQQSMCSDSQQQMFVFDWVSLKLCQSKLNCGRAMTYPIISYQALPKINMLGQRTRMIFFHIDIRLRRLLADVLWQQQ